MALTSRDKLVAFTDRQGMWYKVADATPADGIFVIQVGAEKFQKVIEGPIRARDCGIYANAVDHTAKFSAAINNAAVKEIHFDDAEGGTFVINGAVSIPAGKRIRVTEGNLIGGTGTITGGFIDADFNQAVIGTSLTWNFTNWKFSAKWFQGVNGDFDGTSYGAAIASGKNERPGLQKALNMFNASKNLNNRELFLPKGGYYITDGLTTPNSASWFTISGEGKRNTHIYWAKPNGGSNGIMLQIINGQHGHIKDIGFVGFNFGGHTTPDIVLNIHSVWPPTGTSGMIADMLLERVAILGNLGTYRDGVVLSCAGANASTHDANNEQMTMRDCYIELADRYALSIEHFNSTWHRIFGGRLSGKIAGVNTFRSDNTSGGSFSMYGTTVMGLQNNSSLFRLCGARDQYVLDGVRNEGGDQILYARNSSDASPSSYNIVMRGCSITTAPMAAGYHFDLSGDGGKVTVENCYISSGTTKVKTDHANCHFHINGGKGSFANIDYRGVVTVENYYGLTAPIFNNLGTGKLVIGDGNEGVFNWVTYDQTSGGATPSVEQFETVELQYTVPTTITNFLGGYTGKKILIIATNNNITLQNGLILIPGGQNLKLKTNQAVTLLKLSPSFGSSWIVTNVQLYRPDPGFSLAIDGSTPSDGGAIYKFVVLPDVALTGFKIGTTNGGQEILEPQDLEAGQTYIFDAGYYIGVAGNVYFGGITGSGSAGVYINVQKYFILP